MPDLAMLDYFYGDEAEQFTFYRMQKILSRSSTRIFRRISCCPKRNV